MSPFEFIAWRNRLGLSQAAMAKHLGVTRETVNRWEKGKQPVPAKYNDAGGAATTKAAQRITWATHPELYVKHKANMWTQGPLHPERLLGTRMGENEYGEPSRVPYDDTILRDPAYIAARAAAHDRVKQRLAWENSTLADVYPDALPGETVAQYLARTKI